MPTAWTGLVPANPEVKDPDLRLFAERVRASEDQDRKRKGRAEANWRVYGGDPWAQDTKNQIQRNDGSPATNINLVAPTIDAVAGDQRVNRREVKFKPQDLGRQDQVVADWMTTIVRHFFGRSGHDIESNATMEQLVNALGWMTAYIGYESNGAPTVKIEWPPDYQMQHDTDAVESNLRDARFVLRRKQWDARDAKSRWPGKEDLFTLGQSPHAEPYASEHTVEHQGQHGSGSTTTSKVNQVQIWEYHFYREHPWHAWIDETGVHSLPHAEFDKLYPPETRVKYRDTLSGAEDTVPLSKFVEIKQSAKVPEQILELEQIPSERPESNWHFSKRIFFASRILRGVGGTKGGKHEGGTDAWLEKPTETKLNLFPYVPITGFWQVVPKEDRVERKSLVDRISETQLLIAKILTQTVQMLARSAKGGGFVNKGVLADPSNFSETQGTPGKWHLTTKAVTAGDITPNPSPTFPPFHGELLGRLMDGIQMQSGVSDYFKGTEDRERSNVLVQNMQARTGATLSGLTDPVESGRVMLGTVIMELVQNFILPETIMRILGEDAEVEDITYRISTNPETGGPAVDPDTGEEVREQITTAADLLKARSVVDFDVVVDTGEASANEKDAILGLMGQLMPTVESLPAPLQDLIFKVFVRALPMPKGESVPIAEEFARQLDEVREMQTFEGVMAAVQGMGPEEQEQILAAIESMLPPPEEVPPEEQAPAGVPPEQPIQ